MDENLPTSLVEALVQLGHDADSVQQEALQGSPDAGVWAAAQPESLDEPEQTTEEAEAARAEEIQQRLANVDAGVVTPVPWPEARRRILAAANGRREAR
ncbi:DUF5615 family PIN-like protein [Sorangium sp. So ce185]|uniref:DUF5615 family PIN-like protein n=1 Tax=Sorangium sp. So ce185 TaxID=3133287 RepID=UPI003F5DBB4B